MWTFNAGEVSPEPSDEPQFSCEPSAEPFCSHEGTGEGSPNGSRGLGIFKKKNQAMYISWITVKLTDWLTNWLT